MNDNLFSQEMKESVIDKLRRENPDPRQEPANSIQYVITHADETYQSDLANFWPTWMGNYQEACFITNYLHDEGVGYSIVEPVNHYKNFFLFGVLQKIFDMNTEEIPVVETTWVRQLIHSSPGLGGQNIYIKIST